jgi:hypothetical protein
VAFCEEIAANRAAERFGPDGFVSRVDGHAGTDGTRVDAIVAAADPLAAWAAPPGA